MNFSGTTPEDIYEWIDNKNNGDDTDYLKGKEDTQEAIGVFRSLYGYTFKNEYRLFCYLCELLCLKVADSLSLYRSFIVLNNDEIITIRLSQHFATSGSTKWAFGEYGKPNLEYHLVINRTQPINPTKDLYYDKLFKSVEIRVREYDLSEFNDGHKRKGIIDEIIALLTNGTSPSGPNENRQYRKMNLTESRLRSIIRESIDNLILREYHNQLRIPFEEYGNGHSFIDEFIDWIQYSSEKGTLPKPKITWEDGIRKGWNEFEKKGNNVWCDYEVLRKFIKGWEDNGFIEFDKNGNLYVERSITMPVPNGNIDSEDSDLYWNQINKYEKNVGGCWAVCRGGSAAYCGNRNETTIILRGYMFLDDIYWADCVRLWAKYSQEYEVRTYPNGRVMLTEIQVGDKTLSMKSFDGPRILKSTYFGDNEFFRSNIAGLGYYSYNKRLIDRQGNEYTEKEYLQHVQQLLKNGIDISEISDFYGKEKEGFISFSVVDKYNFVTKDGDLLSPNQWFDRCYDFENGWAIVILKGEYNFINQNGQILTELPTADESIKGKWFGGCYGFKEGFARVISGTKISFIDQNGKMPFPNKFDWCEDFKGGFAEVQLMGKWCYIDKEGNITEEKPQVSESRIKDIIRECVMDFIKMDMINE